MADANGIINGKKGELGPVEKKWGVDIELKEAEYDPCLSMYGAGQCDAVCITNMDILSPAVGRPGVMVLPTSTSFGADACLVTDDIKSVEDLKGKKSLRVGEIRIGVLFCPESGVAGPEGRGL